jgi:uncharacterized protein
VLPSSGGENQQKHGVSFALAQHAFGDPDRDMAEDIGHSQIEKRYYCIGKVDGGMMTVHISKEQDPDYWCRVLERWKGYLL